MDCEISPGRSNGEYRDAKATKIVGMEEALIPNMIAPKVLHGLSSNVFSSFESPVFSAVSHSFTGFLLSIRYFRKIHHTA